MHQTADIDVIMEAASQSLAQMDYRACESSCLEALALARQNRDWEYYSRILLPLQEARRQRRMDAADGVIRLGSQSLGGSVSDLINWAMGVRCGCMLVSNPHQTSDADALRKAIDDKQLNIDVLYSASELSQDTWLVAANTAPDLIVEIKAPPQTQQDTDLSFDASGKAVNALHTSASSWFLDAGEALGDEALKRVDQPMGSFERVEALERCLDVVADHEIIHQSLADAARAVHLASLTSTT